MKNLGLIVLGLVLMVAMLGAAAVVYLRQTGLDSRPLPGAMETTVMRMARRIAIPEHAENMRNPVPPSADALMDGMKHFADHCAVCHGNNGAGDTEMGRGLYPKAPDMRRPATQNLSDGELFYVIERGIRFTGMPAWGTGTPSGEESTWHLVQFVRHLPDLTESELEMMQEWNPRSPDEIRLEIEEERFLSGGVQ